MTIGAAGPGNWRMSARGPMLPANHDSAVAVLTEPSGVISPRQSGSGTAPTDEAGELTVDVTVDVRSDVSGPASGDVTGDALDDVLDGDGSPVGAELGDAPPAHPETSEATRSVVAARRMCRAWQEQRSGDTGSGT
jgi:hypothetical protein